MCTSIVFISNIRNGIEQKDFASVVNVLVCKKLFTIHNGTCETSIKKTNL